MNKPTSQAIRRTSCMQMIKMSAYGDLSFLPLMITQPFEAILGRLNHDSTHTIWKYCVGWCPNSINFIQKNTNILLSKLWQWKRTFHFSFQIKKKEYIIFNYIWFIAYILEQVFRCPTILVCSCFLFCLQVCLWIVWG